jgi:DNA polymerase I
LISILEKAKSISFDTETTGKDANNVELVGFSFALNPVKHGMYRYLPIMAKHSKL